MSSEVDFTECAACAARQGSPLLCSGCLANRTLITRLRRQLEDLAEQHKLVMPREPFDVRCADALADEVALLIIRKAIDSRSPAADALLDYRDPPEGQGGRLAIAEDAAERWCRVATRAETNTAGAIAAWLAGYGDEPVDARLAAKGILDKKWKRA
jgi:hypothetical protein